MKDHRAPLSDRDLQELAGALRSGRLVAPYSVVALERIVSKDIASTAVETIGRMSRAGFSADQIAATLDMIRSDRADRPGVEDVIDLVTTGPDVPGIDSRDTGVVVRELFAKAEESVLVAGYAVYLGQRVFQTLADRMLENPRLAVRLFLDIARPEGDATDSKELVRRFANRFRKSQWPADRPLPDVYYDPRSLAADATDSTHLHAKTIVVDKQHVFVSSANFTPAGHLRNIEVGVTVNSSFLAQSLSRFFDVLLAAGQLLPVAFRVDDSLSET
jgi:phosphatidylserine/phosphatidylglycerophosphate/cardiolipin synthase-like enzyme